MKGPVTYRNIDLGHRVRALRQRQQVTQRAMCQAVNLTEGCYRAIERGDSTPRCDTLARLCVVLGTTADYLLFGTAA